MSESKSSSSSEASSASSERPVCLACGGRGVISNATEDVKCGACAGSGKAK